MRGSGSHWRNIRVPYLNTPMYFAGVCERICPNGALEITIDDFQIASNVSTSFQTSLTPQPSDVPSIKYQKFDALAFQS